MNSANTELAEDQFRFVAELTPNGKQGIDLVAEYNRQITALSRDASTRNISVVEYQRQITALSRDVSTRDVSVMHWLPQLPESWAQDIYDRIEEQERVLVAPNLSSADYGDGTAIVPDDIREVATSSDSLFVFTAEHATEPVRFDSGKREKADVGTGGLAAVLGQDFGVGIIMNGDQTSNAPTDLDHPIKDHIARYIERMDGFMSVHGAASGKFVDTRDKTEIQAIVGLGTNPSELQRIYGETLVRAAQELGLYAIIGNDTEYAVQILGSDKVKLNEDGTEYRHKLAAERATTTTNFTQDLLAEHGRQEQPAFQVELTRFLRWTPLETDKRDKVSRVIGVALGYKLVQTTVQYLSTPGVF